LAPLILKDYKRRPKFKSSLRRRRINQRTDQINAQVLPELFHSQYSSEPEGGKTLLLFPRLRALSAGRVNAEFPAITNKENRPAFTGYGTCRSLQRKASWGERRTWPRAIGAGYSRSLIAVCDCVYCNVARVGCSRFFPEWAKPQTGRLNKSPHTVHATSKDRRRVNLVAVSG
jgi:hypothetical protein